MNQTTLERLNFTTVPISPNYGLTVTSDRGDDILAIDRQQVTELFNSFGVLLFRGFDVQPEKFKKFTELFSDTFMPYIGGAIPRDTIDGDRTVLAVTGNKLGFEVPLHGELYYMQHRPAVIWFYCVTPPDERGETTFCDGIAIYNALRKSTQELLETKRLKYVRVYPKHIWQKMFQTEDFAVVGEICQQNNITFTPNYADLTITTESIRAAIVPSRDGKQRVFINNMLPLLAGVMGETKSFVRFEDDSEIPEVVYREIQEAADRLTLEVSWQQGDMLAIDNTRFLHGRRSYSDFRRNIYVRLCDPVS